MALPQPLILLSLFLLSTVYSAPQGCADVKKKDYTPAKFTEVVGKWNLVAGAYKHITHRTLESMHKYMWMEITSQENATNLYLAYATPGTIGVEKIASPTYTEESFGITFRARSNVLILVQTKISDDCITVTLPGDINSGLLLTCTSATAPKSVVEDFVQNAACNKFPFTNVRENPINYASICTKELDAKHLIGVTEISGRWTLIAKASTNSSSMTADENYMNDGIEVTIKCDDLVTLKRSPDSKNLEEIVEGEYDIQTDELNKRRGANRKDVTLWFYHTCADCLLMGIWQRDSLSTTLVLLSRSGTAPAYEKEKFKTHILCRSLSHVYGIPYDQQSVSASVSSGLSSVHEPPTSVSATVSSSVSPEMPPVTAGSVCEKKLRKDPLQDTSKIAGSWKLMAKASQTPIFSETIKFSLDGKLKIIVRTEGAVTVSRKSDTGEVNEIKEGNYIIQDNQLHLKTEAAAITVYESCPNFLLLYLAVNKVGSQSSTLFLFASTKAWRFNVIEKNEFDIQARCKNLTYIYKMDPFQMNDYEDF